MNLTCALRGHDWDSPRYDEATRKVRVRCARCGRRSPGIAVARGPRVLFDRPDERWAAQPQAKVLSIAARRSA